MNYLRSWTANHGFYIGKTWTHPACCECGTLYPKMRVYAAVRDTCEAYAATACCSGNTCDWDFVVGTRKGKVNLTVRSRVTAIQKRGAWAALGM